MTRYRVLSWDGIPAQVKASAEGERPVSVQLSNWFIEHIDREAMRRDLAGSDEYLEKWDWSDYMEREGTAEEVAAAVAAELEAEWEERRRAWEAGADEV